jgi:hypothetical protein
VRRSGFVAVATLLISLLLSASARPARADETVVDKITRINKKAVDAYDNLNFAQARSMLEDALTVAEAANLGGHPVVARTHLNLGLVLLAGFKLRDEAKAQFRAALKIQPHITPPEMLFNPETQAVFDDAKAEAEADSALAARKSAVPGPGAGAGRGAQAEDPEVIGKEPPAPGPAAAGRRVLISLGIGTGAGVAKGSVETNQNFAGERFEWTGGVSTSRLVQLALEGGYFLTPSLLLSIEGRLQLVTGTNKVWTSADCSPCTPPATALAGLAKATWFFSQEKLRPFASIGLGAGRIREVVKLSGLTDCGGTAQSHTDQCYDTVAGGPFIAAAGGGMAYDLGPILLLGSLTAHLGVPDTMLNVDVLLGAGLRL